MANTSELLAANDLSLENSGVVLSGMLNYDEKTGRFSGEGSDEANALLKREYRKGYAVPETV